MFTLITSHFKCAQTPRIGIKKQRLHYFAFHLFPPIVLPYQFEGLVIIKAVALLSAIVTY